MRSLAFPALLLTFAVSQTAYSQYGFEDFLKAVESGQQNNTKLNSPRLAQLPSGPEELPAPKPTSPDLSSPALESAQPSPSDRKPATSNDKVPAQQPPVIAQPTPLQEPSPAELPNLTMPTLPNPINFEEAFAQQEIGLSVDSNNGGMTTGDCDCYGRAGTSHASCSSGTCSGRGCNVMAHYPVNLPPPSTLRGYFNASPCIANVWDGYACEAAKECQKTQQHIQHASHAGGAHKTRCE